MMMDVLSNKSVIFIALVVSMLWAIKPIIQKYILRKTPWKLFVVFNGLINVMLLTFFGIFFYKEIRDEIKTIKIRDIILLLMLLSFINLIAASLYYYILATKNTYDVIIITSLYFIGTILLNAMIFNEVMSIYQIMATVMVIFAIGLTALN
jgi:drug/metabolite transporter (DMT)-like permease